MGQKVNPIGIRLGITREWSSKWYAGKKQFPLHVHTDFRVREFLRKKLAEASVSRIQIERAANKVNITIQTARPGIVIGRRGAEADRLRAGLTKITGNAKVQLNIQEIKQPELDAALIAQGVADQLAGRVAFRRAMKRAVQSALRLGAEGIRITCSGRLGGAEIARTEIGDIVGQPEVPALRHAAVEVEIGIFHANDVASRLQARAGVERDLLRCRRAADHGGIEAAVEAQQQIEPGEAFAGLLPPEQQGLHPVVQKVRPNPG